MTHNLINAVFFFIFLYLRVDFLPIYFLIFSVFLIIYRARPAVACDPDKVWAEKHKDHCFKET